MTDPEITRELATRIMGWPVSTTYQEVGERSLQLTGQWAAVDEPGLGGKVVPHFALDPAGKHWEPLRNIAHAWELWDRLRERGVFKVESSSILGDVRCSFDPFYLRGNLPPGLFPAYVGGPFTAPRAICLCALRACGVEV